MEMAHSASLIPCQGKKVNWKFIHINALEARSNLCTDYVTQTQPTTSTTVISPLRQEG